MSGQGHHNTEEAMRKDTTNGRVSETITRRIRKAITEGRLAPGEKLPAEREMAQRLRASRVSVREAYRSLAEAGLVSIRRGAEGGAFIADFDPVPVSRSVTFLLRLGRTSQDELTEARALLEPSVARLAARRAGPEELARLEELLRTEQAAPRGSSGGRHRLQIEIEEIAPSGIGRALKIGVATPAVIHGAKNLHRRIHVFRRARVVSTELHDLGVADFRAGL